LKKEKDMKKEGRVFTGRNDRRSFLKNGVVAAGAMTAGVGLVSGPVAFADNEDRSPITKGDIAILTFLSALEQVEADLWIQYAELGGPTPAVPSSFGLSPIDLELNGKKIVTGLAPAYITGLQVLDTDMPQYIADNTDDEISHHRFLNNYLASKGAKTIDLSSFAIIPPSRVSGVPQNGRLTNLKQLTVDTTWWTRYRSATQNPDLGGKFQNAVPDLAKGQHPAIPESDADLALDSKGNISTHLQAIANTAGFHFGFIEQGGTSLYPTLAQKVTNLEVLQILLSIGPSETMHFQVWHDKAGNAQVLTDGNLSFPDLNSGINPNGGSETKQQVADSFQTNLIMPEPTFFLHQSLGPVSIIRPTTEAGGGGAVSAVMSFVNDGLFIDPATGKDTGIVAKLMTLAEAADDARRGF
jgi:Ferritin-like domain